MSDTFQERGIAQSGERLRVNSSHVRVRRGIPTTPCTLHPAPHTPHSTPYTLHPTPYTPHATRYTLHPILHTLRPTLHTRSHEL